MLKRLWTFIISLFTVQEEQPKVEAKPRARVIDFVKPMYATQKEMVGAEPLTPLPVSSKNIIVLHGTRKKRPMQEECPVDLNEAFLQSIQQHERPSVRRRRQEYEEWKNGISTYESLRKIITS